MATCKIVDRPVCETEGCGRLCQVSRYLPDGIRARYKRVCQSCHSKRVAARHGCQRISQVLAKNRGMTETEYSNSIHKYRKYRKEFCENIDGRLGFICTTTVVWVGMLDVDHINGNPFDNTEKNLQTLCKCCHSYKTNQRKDYSTAGRKTLIKKAS